LIEIASGIFGRLFNEARPIDWLIVAVDLLVLLWITAADIVKIPHWRRSRRARKRIVAFVAEGESIEEARPTAVASDDEANAWIERVKSWTVGVHSYLAKHALQAVTVFGHAEPQPQAGSAVHPLAAKWLSDLDARLSALRSIMEKPNLYF